MSINRQIFFDNIRQTVFRGSLSQSQVDGLNYLLGVWEENYTMHDRRFLAFCLATAYHETAHTMQPIEEYGKGRGKKYGRANAKGLRFYGRGYVQLTWESNYTRAEKEIDARFGDVELDEAPQNALDPEIAAHILYLGCIEGWFTGKKLSDYIKPNTKADYYHARRVVNGLDRAGTIEGYANAFDEALSAATAPSAVRKAPPPAEVKPPVTGKPMPQSTTVWTTIGTAVSGALSAIAGLDRYVAIVVVLVIAAGAFWIIRERYLKSKNQGV